MRLFVLLVASFLAGGGQAVAGPPTESADLVLIGAKIVTQNAQRETAEALAVKDGKIVYVGSDEGIVGYIGPNTRSVEGDGRLVLPGLIDSHIHPLGTIVFDSCDLQSKARSLAEITAFVRACIAEYNVPPGEWVRVSQWEMSAGNAPDESHPDLRAALDAASSIHPIMIVGWSGHHSGFNSLGLALAENSNGAKIGLSKDTLANEFANLVPYVGTRADGEPNGVVNDHAKRVIDTSAVAIAQRDQLLKQPYLVAERLNSVGITAVQDAAAGPDGYAVYDAMQESGRLTFRLNFAQLFEPEAFRDETGTVNYARLFEQADAIRAKYAADPLIKADALKIFADGIVESDPTSVPPTLGNSPRLVPYLQPIFKRDEEGRLAINGYVDPASPACGYARANTDAMTSPAAIKRFQENWGFHPAQCAIFYGVPNHDPVIFNEYVRQAHLNDYTLHIHAISDAALRMTVDAIETARAEDGRNDRPDTIAHVEFGNPADISRAGRNNLFLAFTFSWIYAEPEGFDLSVVPFYNKVTGTSFAELHDPDSAFERDYYPVKTAKSAGVTVVAGSDAPVLTNDPQPFVNMEFAVTRAKHGLPPTSPWQRLTVQEALDAYTIDGARALGRESEIGSLEAGKSADFIIIDQDIFALANMGKVDRIGKTNVLSTWFMGNEVYRAPDTR